MALKPTLIYVYDPLCGWCFGFHPVIEKIVTRFDERLNVEVKPGGLAIGDKAQPIGEGYSYIKDSTEQVEDITGAEFGRNFKLLAEEGSYLYDSEPSCLAQLAMNRLEPESSLKFAGDMQKALFVEGKSLNEWGTFDELLNNYNIENKSFKKLWSSDELKQELHKEFAWCKKAGATGFPTLLLQIGDEISRMARGYRPYDVIESHLHHLINNIEKMSS